MVLQSRSIGLRVSPVALLPFRVSGKGQRIKRACPPFSGPSYIYPPASTLQTCLLKLISLSKQLSFSSYSSCWLLWDHFFFCVGSLLGTAVCMPLGSTKFFKCSCNRRLSPLPRSPFWFSGATSILYKNFRIASRPVASMQNISKDSKVNEGNNSTTTESPKPLETLVSHSFS